MINKVFSLLIILLPILYQYKSPIYSISLGEFLLIPFIIYYFFNHFIRAKMIKVDRNFILFNFITVITTLIVALNGVYYEVSDSMTIIFRMVFYIFLISAAYEYFDFIYAMKIYRKIVLILSFYLIIQYIYTNVTKDYLPIYLNYNWLFGPEQRAYSLANNYKYIFRPSSLFLEPSYFSLYVFPSIGYYLLYSNENIKFRISKSLFITIALIISSSGAGMIGVVLIWSFYIYVIIRSNFNFKNLLILATIIFIMILVYNSNFAEVGVDRLANGGSIGPRIERGVIIYKNLDIFNKIFGIGLNNLSNYMNYNNISTIYDEGNLNYLAGFIGILVNSGIIGLCFMFRYLISLLKNVNNKLTLIIILLYIFCSVYEGMVFSYRMGFYLIIIYGSMSMSKNTDNGGMINESRERIASSILS